MQTKPWYCPNCGREYRVPIEASGLGPCQRCKAGEPPPLDRTGENRRLKIAMAAARTCVPSARQDGLHARSATEREGVRGSIVKGE